MTPPQRHGSYVMDVDLSSDGKRMATASSDKTARIWDVETGQLRKTFEGHDGRVQAVVFLPDGSIASCGEDKLIRIWNHRFLPVLLFQKRL